MIPTPRVPAEGTIERWCFEYITGTELAAKLSPGPAPDSADERAWEVGPQPLRLTRPGRPPELCMVAAGESTRLGRDLSTASARSALFHRFAHHELQAAELFAWALLAFADAPRAFRQGLLALVAAEIDHLHLYLGYLRQQGLEFGAHPLRDYFWERMLGCTTPQAFVALQGLGLEGANLDHCRPLARQFRKAGDEVGARVLERIEEDEIGHVAFAKHWFEHFTGAPLTYAAWGAALPEPVTPSVLHGRTLNREARARAGLDAAFLDALARAPSPHLPRTRSA